MIILTSCCWKAGKTNVNLFTKRNYKERHLCNFEMVFKLLYGVNGLH